MTEQSFLEDMKNRLTLFPGLVSLEITTKCSLNCIYCDRSKAKKKNYNLDKAGFALFLNNLQKFTKIMFLGIGEIFCNPDIYEFIRLAEDKRIILFTNGTLPVQYEKIAANVELILFSLDSIDEKKIRQICGNFNFRILLNNLRKSVRYTHFQSFLNCTINSVNISDLADIVKLAAQFGIPGVHYEIPVGMDEFVLENVQVIQQSLKAALKTAQAQGIYLENPYRIKCLMDNKVVPYVNIAGDVFPCCEALRIDYPVGNITESSFDIIWQGTRYNEFKQLKLCTQCAFVRNLSLLKG